MNRVLITGGCGFLGSNLAKRMINEGYFVRVFDNSFRGNKSKLGNYFSDIDFVEGDIRDLDAVDKACQGMDVIFHLAFINGTKYFYEIPEKVLEVGVKGAMNTLEAALKNNLAKYILASSSEVYQEPTAIPTPETERAIIPDIMNPRYSYAGGKIISELLAINYCRHSKMTATIFRPHNIYGPDMGFEHVIPEFILRMKKLSDNFRLNQIEFPLQGTGKETRAFCYIDDFIDGLMVVLKSGNPNEIYNIGNDHEEIPISDLAEKIAHLLNLHIKINHQESPLGSAPRRRPCIDKLKKLGYNPTVSLEDGLLKTIEWYISRND
ncbi:MAG: NAD-dependent epimerase/dehydratase family protein [Bacillota bacterium]